MSYIPENLRHRVYISPVASKLIKLGVVAAPSSEPDTEPNHTLNTVEHTEQDRD